MTTRISGAGDTGSTQVLTSDKRVIKFLQSLPRQVAGRTTEGASFASKMGKFECWNVTRSAANKVKEIK